MDKSDVQVLHRKNPSFKDLNIYDDGTLPIDRLKSFVKSLFDKDDKHEALHNYTRTYRSKLRQTEFLEVFVDEIVAKVKANWKHFSLDLLLCRKCNDIIKDPVTLKCGHTISKKCALLEAQNDFFSCTNCSQNCSFSYLSQLKKNVVVLSLINKLSEKISKHVRKDTAENHFFKMYENIMFLKSSRDYERLASMENSSCFLYSTSTTGYLKKANVLLNLGNFKEAFKAYLTCYVMDSNAYHAKVTAIEILQKILQKRSLSCHDRTVRNSGSSESLHVPEDDGSSSDEDETIIVLKKYDQSGLHVMLENFCDSIKKIRDEKNILSWIDVSIFDKKEFECPLCIRILWQPVTTTCGHTFCKGCLNRCFDHQPTCPLCKASLTAYLAERVQSTTEVIELAIKNLYPSEYSERQKLFLEEMEHLLNAGKDPEHEIPLFVCTVALPTVPCPLHVYEPRYRFMIRQCMESGSKQFGMCGVVDEEIAEYGTMLEIRDVQYFPDGRSIVDTVGYKRFRILKKGERDGYHTAAIEYLEDEPLSDTDLQSIEEKHDRTYKISKTWFKHLPANTQHQILEHFGPMPHVETDYVSSSDGPSWLWWMLAILPVETRLKVLLVSFTSLVRRLDFLYRIILHFQSTIIS